MNFAAIYDRYRIAFEEALTHRIDEAAKGAFPRVLWESMRYSLLAGGKRIRPVLFLATLDCLGLDWRKELTLAIAIESIHTYSLIHDDLPAMDDDDFRRGMPSNHIKFGEANAILAGDGLLSWAFELMFRETERGKNQREAARILAHAAGVYGMVAGQSADLLWQEGGERELEFLYANKTGRMLSAPLSMASALADNRDRAAWTAFGDQLGNLFQLTDDLLDAGSGEDDDRLTAVKVYGVEGAEKRADDCANDCLRLLKEIDGDTGFFEGLVGLVRSRKI